MKKDGAIKREEEEVVIKLHDLMSCEPALSQLAGCHRREGGCVTSQRKLRGKKRHTGGLFSLYTCMFWMRCFP